MGTNYYATEPPCPSPCRHCTPGEWHICKSLTTFQAYDDTRFGPLTSWGQWKAAILTHGLIVRDEYGVTLTAGEFINDVEATAPANRRRQYDWMVDHYGQGSPDLDRDYLDPNGFSFYRGEFS